jgi:cyclopropane-fatty-acyl-phospholipid synthase
MARWTRYSGAGLRLGWLTLWMAEHFPHSRITGVSNSASQRTSILESAAACHLNNLQIITADMNDFAARGTYDRIVSVEMFEHMRNWKQLLYRASTWLPPEGKMFIPIFTHTRFAYPFKVRSPGDWMARHFFTGGMMPSGHWLLKFQNDLQIRVHWRVNGSRYQKTAEAWLANLDSRKAQLLPLLAETYGKPSAQKWWVRWPARNCGGIAMARKGSCPTTCWNTPKRAGRNNLSPRRCTTGFPEFPRNA